MANTPLRVCHVLEATSAGVRQHAMDLVVGQLERGLDITLVYSDLRADTQFLRLRDQLSGRIPFVRIQMSDKLDPLRDLRAVRRLRRLLLEEHFEVIHTHSGKAGLIGRAAAAGLSSSVFYTPNASPFRIRRAYASAERALQRLTTEFIAVSDSERRELVDHGIARTDQVVTVPNGVDPTRFRCASETRKRLRDELGIAGGFLVGSVGRLSPQKDPLTFVRAAAAVSNSMTDAHFVWIGDGELRSDVIAEVTRLGLDDRFHMPGVLPDVRAHLCAMDVFCLLSRYEGLPYAVLEAMASGLPVVATHVTGNRDLVIEGETGHLVPVGDPLGAASAIHELGLDVVRRTAFGAAAKLRIESGFTVRQMVDAVIERYQRASPP